MEKKPTSAPPTTYALPVVDGAGDSVEAQQNEHLANLPSYYLNQMKVIFAKKKKKKISVTFC